MVNSFFVDSANLPPAALDQKHRLERDPSARTDPMAYQPGMERIDSDIKDRVLARAGAFDAAAFTTREVRRALDRETRGIDDFAALLSPAAAPFLEEMAAKARLETRKHFGNTVYLFTPLYIANFCENYCVYCGFNRYNDIRRMRLGPEQIEHEMAVIAKSGMASP